MQRSVLALLLIVAAAPAAAQPAFTDGGTAVAAAVRDGETLMLSDGRVLRLVDIAPPRAAPRAAAAKSALEALVIGQTLSLQFNGPAEDRQGRIAAEVFVGKRWIQGELLRRGLALVASTVDHRIGVPEMLALERQARRYRRGLWADAADAIVPAETAWRQAGRFALVSGTIARVARASRGMVLAFGPDSTTDRRHAFALTIAPDALALCRQAGLDPAALVGKTLLVRGFIDGPNRPAMAITHPEQIEILRKRKAAAKPGSPL